MGILDGKVSIVTEGERGIGRAIAEGFAQEGTRVVVTAAWCIPAEEGIR